MLRYFSDIEKKKSSQSAWEEIYFNLNSMSMGFWVIKNKIKINLHTFWRGQKGTNV